MCLSPTGLLPLCSGKVARAGGAVPGAVGVSGEAALGTGFPVNGTPVQGELCDPCGGAGIELLLWKEFTVRTKITLFFKYLFPLKKKRKCYTSASIHLSLWV